VLRPGGSRACCRMPEACVNLRRASSCSPYASRLMAWTSGRSTRYHIASQPCCTRVQRTAHPALHCSFLPAVVADWWLYDILTLLAGLLPSPEVPLAASGLIYSLNTTSEGCGCFVGRHPSAPSLLWLLSNRAAGKRQG
jgi:hypothetical protein